MKLRGVMVAVISAALGWLAAAGEAGAQVARADAYAAYRTVAGWKIQSSTRNGTPYSCNATMPPGASRGVDLIQYADGDKWAFTIPNLGFTGGTKADGMLEIGRASEPVSIVAAIPGIRDRIWLSAGVLSMLRSSAMASIVFGNKRYDVPLDNIGQVMGSIQDCVIALRKSGGTAAGTAPAPAPAPQAAPSVALTDYCNAYANEMVASATRGRQTTCPALKNASQDHDLHFNWCMKTARPKVEEARMTMGGQLDGCLMSYGKSGKGG